ncbi:TetR/AcrR family transcriptional regulator [Anaerosporobacter sp.]
MKAEKTKENIIMQTIALIQEGKGDIESITIRKIAERAGASVGLINHYFGTKDALIEVCVDRSIHEVVHSFSLEQLKSDNPVDVTKITAKTVVDFLMDNIHVSNISILSDLKSPSVKNNTMSTVMGFVHCLSGGNITEKQKQQTFALTSMLQEAFLQRDILKEVIGIDFYDKEARDQYIDWMIDCIVTK